jgi:3-demethylubiquinone-9 3-methyltransferase (EC 2.1.1.64)
MARPHRRRKRRMTAPSTAESNVDTDDVARFGRLAATWWDPRGAMAPLHVINPVRLRYIEERVGALAGLRALDVGCGGGLLTEAWRAPAPRPPASTSPKNRSPSPASTRRTRTCRSTTA